MENIIKILMKRDNMSYSEAKTLCEQTKDEMIGDPDNADEIMMDNLGLEMDYIFDLLS